MKRIHQGILLCLLMIAGSLPFTSMAEGNCPPGMYPIGGQGSQGCAPIPVSSTGSQYNNRPNWAQTVLGVAMDARGDTFISNSMRFRGKAKRASMKECREFGKGGCTLATLFQAQSVAVAHAGLGTETTSVVAAMSEQGAVIVAMQQCSAKAAWRQMPQDQCRISNTACTADLFIR
ncbi:DUF4189 domain-containing protein [Stenotrophomonas indicatrix]